MINKYATQIISCNENQNEKKVFMVYSWALLDIKLIFYAYLLFLLLLFNSKKSRHIYMVSYYIKYVKTS